MSSNLQRLPPTREIARAGLLERIDRGRARIVSFIAPAGFGKSTTALQIASAAGRFSVCDCGELESDIDLARRILTVLAREPEAKNVGFLIQCQLALGLPTISVEEQLALVAQAWRNADDDTIVIFENAEHIARSPSAMRMFAQLLINIPESRRLFVCSRVTLPLRLSRFVTPDALETLRASDLAFTPAELEEAFVESALPANLLDRAATVSQGWPMVTMLLARFAREGRLASILDKLDDVAFDDVRDYLAAEVLGALDGDILHGLAVCAFVPHAKLADVTVALTASEAVSAFEQFTRDTPLISMSRGVFELHPLLRSTLVQRCAARRTDILERVAVAAERAGEEVRAAQLHILRGDQEAAAAALNRVDWLERPTPSPDEAQLLGALDRSVIRRYPRLWAQTILYGRFSFDPHVALGEAHALLREMGPLTPVAVRSYVVRPLAGYLSRLGMHDLGYRMIREFESETQIAQTPKSFDEAGVVYIRMMIAGRLGKLAEFHEQAARAWPYASKSDGMSTLLLVERAAEVERAEGRRDAERATLDAALVRARQSGVGVNVAFALAESVFGAWFAGEDETLGRFLDELEFSVLRDGVRGFAYFVDCARGRHDRAPSGMELPKWVVAANLLACSHAADDRERARHALAANEAALQYGAPFMQVLAALAHAEYVADSGSESLEVAIRAAQRVESDRLSDAVAAFVGGETRCGMLEAFAQRLRARHSTLPDCLEIDVLAGNANVGGTPVVLSGRQLELTIALACRRLPSSRQELQELLWPDADGHAAQNAFNICLHHVRRRLGNAVVRTANGYALDGQTRVDLWEIEDVVGRIRSRSSLNELERTTLRRLYRKLCAPRPKRMLEWAWFEGHERRIAESRCEVAEILAREALSAGEPTRAIEFARAIIAYDSCDESARAMVIGSLLAAGETAAAKREYRRYVALLERELQATPSFSFEDLTR